MEGIKFVGFVVVIVFALFGAAGTLSYAHTQQRLKCIDKVKHLPAPEIVMVCGK